MRSGNVGINRGRFRLAGHDSYSWLQSASSIEVDGIAMSSSYYFYFHDSGVATSYGPIGRWFGFSLHCPESITICSGGGEQNND